MESQFLKAYGLGYQLLNVLDLSEWFTTSPHLFTSFDGLQNPGSPVTYCTFLSIFPHKNVSSTESWSMPAWVTGICLPSSTGAE